MKSLCFGRATLTRLHPIVRGFHPVECDKALIFFDRHDGEHGRSVAFDGDRAFCSKRKAFADLGRGAGKGYRTHDHVHIT